ncbi:hypothetical protein BN1232_00735 [Mycobacterium lentiflavum]|uniref:PD-(D/E)XK motif protein n=2 Tax=Mycobacterium lentiflavum TaxID=141349 RepID=A0A0E4GVC4_MYCLN|nr:hypothetical protein BN1232_00735 [Mycobacterium lentiflavum]
MRPATLIASVRTLTFRNTTAATYLDISCSEKDLFPEFDDVIADILRCIASSEMPASDASAALARLRRLFRSRLSRGLGHEAKLGLFAELSVLHALLSSGCISVENWRGPLREPHDFECPSRCVEVKALSEQGDGFIVHGWEQLDTHDDRPLVLALVIVVPDPDGLTVGELVSEVGKVTDSASVLNSRLIAAGWDVNGSDDDSDRFSLGPTFVVPVSESVPRLIPAMLLDAAAPEGLSDLRYRVSLDSVIPFTVASSLQALADSEV